MIEPFIYLNNIGLSNELLPGFLNTFVAYLNAWSFIWCVGFIILVSWVVLTEFFPTPKTTLANLLYDCSSAFQDIFYGGDIYFKALMIIMLLFYPFLFISFFGILYFFSLSCCISCTQQIKFFINISLPLPQGLGFAPRPFFIFSLEKFYLLFNFYAGVYFYLT